MGIKIHKIIIATLIAALVATVALTGINCVASQPVEIRSEQVAILPIEDGVGVDLPWDVAQELTRGVRERIADDLTMASDGEGYDYVVGLKLIRYEEVRAGDHSELKADIQVSIVSSQDGEVVREEVIKMRHPMPRGGGLIDYTDLTAEDYLHTPKAVAHNRLSKDVADRVDQILV